MTKRHFNRLALALRAYRASDGASLTTDQFDALIGQVALACDELSDNFDFGLFEEAALKPYAKNNTITV